LRNCCHTGGSRLQTPSLYEVLAVINPNLEVIQRFLSPNCRLAIGWMCTFAVNNQFKKIARQDGWGLTKKHFYIKKMTPWKTPATSLNPLSITAVTITPMEHNPKAAQCV
jgi:hypothetical protein